MNSEIQNIKNILKGTFGKKAWHGPTIKEVLEGITSEQATNSIGNSHTIIELLAHMTAWRIFVVKKLEGDQDYKVTEDLNFPVVSDLQKTIAGLEESQVRLLDALAQFPESQLHEIVPHSSYNYSFYTLLHGIVHHDLYHLGQIALLKKS